MTKLNLHLPIIGDLAGADQDAINTGLRRGATRRQVMSWLIAGGATIAAAGSIVSSATGVMAATPKKGGKIVYAADLHGPQMRLIQL